ncbi:protein NO VEIN domain-containing protein [Micromonospora echinaurantiaca]|uniref:protein NO VEIN domain-containing protein n=1 Tax=Micromonospora echinaurantiaca TaxID=47857 RepID=UPI003447F1E4
MHEAAGGPRSGTARSRGINYHGNLGRMLRDLTGFATLTFELLQNADDAGATTLRVDITYDALVVFNDAVFSDCGDQDRAPGECLFLAERGHRCDFHSFREVAGGDKRDRTDTTGAFGIGFTAVYQVADTAMLVSNGRRWDIDEMQPEERRIMESPASDADGTTFILPWARDPNSLFRQATGSAAVAPDGPQRLFDALVGALPTAMLFLRHVRTVELLRDGQTVCGYVRQDADDLREIIGGDEPRQWLMLHGDFAEAAAALREEFPGKIEDRRRSDVTVAVPLTGDVDGLLCAYLPTDERSGLPLHVNADFYPESDRRHLIVDSFHGQWNRLAVRAAARVLANRLPDLAPLLGHEQLWRLIFAAYEARSARPDSGIGAFWEQINRILAASPVMWTTTSEWTTPANAVFLYSSDEDEAIPVLEQLGLLVMHPDVGAFVRRMPGRSGARQLSIEILATALQDKGLTGPTSAADLPAAIATRESREILWRELERLLTRTTSSMDRMPLRRTAVVPGMDGRLWPAEQLKRADRLLTARLVTDLSLGVALLDETALPPGCDGLTALCPQLDLPFVLTLLANNDGAQRLRDALGIQRVTAAQVLSWLRSYEQAILGNPDLRTRVRGLPVYPTGSGYRPLDEVVLPGGFTDRLGVAEAIDCEQVRDHIGFLERLGVKQLTLHTYLTTFVPQAARRRGMLTDSRWRQLVVDLAGRLDQFDNDAQVRQALSPLPLVACGTGFLPASACYFLSGTVTEVLGAQAPVARPLPVHESSTKALYEWLGVAHEPRLNDVVERVRHLAAGTQDAAARQSVAAIISFLGRLVPDRRNPVPAELNPLRDLAWLPAHGDNTWYRPAEVHNIFRQTLFATQGRFLAVPAPLQQDAANFLHWLGVQTNPSVPQVVAHLLTLVRQGAPVGRDVYAELNRNSAHEALDHLVGLACLPLPDGGYVAPTAVFRQQHPFGRFRWQLDSEFDALGDLLDRLGVKRIPDHNDARAVLLDVAREQRQRFHEPVEDEHDLAVIWRCWQMLDEALTHGDVEADWFTPLRDLPVVPNAAAVLTPPTRLLIDDMPGVAEALNIVDAVIRRKEGMWRAFQAAGVRSMTEAVSVEILQMHETTRVGAVREQLETRRPALVRVLDSNTGGLQRLDETLAQLSFPQTPVLRVRYHLRDFGLASDDTRLKALYVPADPDADREAQLISCPHDDGWPWMLIAKEFARALYPGETPGPLASSLYVALSALSLDAAHTALDDAGWPRLEHVDVTPAEAGPTAGFGNDIPAGEPHDSEAQHTPDTAADVTDAVDQPNDTSTTPGTQPAGTARTRATGARPIAGNDPQGVRGATADGSDGRIGSRRGVAYSPPSPRRSPEDAEMPRGRRGRLRSYVMVDDSDRANRKAVDRSPIDRAGIGRVVAAEREAGRHPEVMAHNNPGFDVTSRDDTGQVLRHVEVKSTSGEWNDMGVALSRRQFDFAQQHPDTFWLYVVEHALDDAQARILRIANPATRAEEFRFDGGWAAVSEDAGSDPPPPAQVQTGATKPGRGWIPLRTLREDLTVAAEPEEWVYWPGMAGRPGTYAVQLLGHALEPELARGDLVLVEPIRDQPHDDDLVVVQLRSGFDPDTRATATVRWWSLQIDDESIDGSLTLAAAQHNSAPPLYTKLSMVDVCGRVVASFPRSGTALM